MRGSLVELPMTRTSILSSKGDGMKTTEEIVDKVEKVAAVLRDKIGTPPVEQPALGDE